MSRLVILAASVFEISYNKEIDKQRRKPYPRDCCRRGNLKLQKLKTPYYLAACRHIVRVLTEI